MLRSHISNGFSLEGWRSDDVNQGRALASRADAPRSRSLTVLQRGAAAAGASDRYRSGGALRFARSGHATPSEGVLRIRRNLVASPFDGHGTRVFTRTCVGVGRQGTGGGPAWSGGQGNSREEQGETSRETKGAKRKMIFARLWREAKQERRRLITAMLCLLTSSATNMMTPTIMAKVIDRASRHRGGRAVHSGEGDKSSSDVCIAGRQISDRIFFLGALGVFALGSLASWGRVYNIAMASAGVAGRLRSKLFASLMEQDKEFFDAKKAGELTPVLAEDVVAASQVFGDKSAAILRSLNSAINASVALLFISPSLTAVSISMVPLMGATAMTYSKRVKARTMQLRDVDAAAQAFATERLSNIRTVRAFANERLESDRFEKMVKETSELRSREAGAQGTFRAGLFGMTGVSLMAVFWVGGSRVGQGFMTAGQLTSFAGYSFMVGLGFSGLATAHADLSRGLVSADRVFSVTDRIPAVSLDDGRTPSDGTDGNLEFREVHFQYEGRDKPILQGINLKLSRGKVVALTGASGVGKSTLAALVSRLYEPNRGTITLDGVDIASLNSSWLRQQVGVVDQEPVLFAGTIADNIRYGVPDAGDDRVEEAAKQANAHDFIMAFPQQYRTKVGEMGLQLSGGEKQRVAIARAVLKNPPLLVLDEATSALDAEAERLVSEAIDRLVEQRTVLIIAHRQSTIRKADEVAVLDEGKIVEVGAYEDLMSKPSSALSQLLRGHGADLALP